MTRLLCTALAVGLLTQVAIGVLSGLGCASASQKSLTTDGELSLTGYDWDGFSVEAGVTKEAALREELARSGLGLFKFEEQLSDMGMPGWTWDSDNAVLEVGRTGETVQAFRWSGYLRTDIAMARLLRQLARYPPADYARDRRSEVVSWKAGRFVRLVRVDHYEELSYVSVMVAGPEVFERQGVKPFELSSYFKSSRDTEKIN